MAKHTPGPWDIAVINNGQDDDEIVTEVNGCMVNIAAVFGAGEYSEARPDGNDEPHYEVSKEEAAANARMIAAAPKMLAALELAATFCEQRGGSWAGFETAVRAAIAEATAE